MNSTTWKCILAFALMAPCMPACAQDASAARPGAESRVPLVVLRFNQQDLDFKSALRDAVTTAMQAKPNVIFDIVLRPAAQAQATPHRVDNNNLAKVVTTVLDLNLPNTRLTAQTAEVGTQPFDEVDVYVR